MNRLNPRGVVAASFLLFAGTICGVSFRANAGVAVLPKFSPADFTPAAPINNPYFPLPPGTTFIAGANVTDPDSGRKSFERSEDFVTGHRENVGGVQAMRVHARVFHDNLLIEDTIDFFAQDKVGNVWYLGEATRAFEYDSKGKLIGTSTEGSWRTGVHGAKPGFIMPAHPVVGFHYYQEFSPIDHAVDEAQITAVTGTVTVPAGVFTPAIKTLETTAVEPGVLENKFYGRGAGLILTEEEVDPSGKPLNRIPLTQVKATAVPLPPAAAQIMVGLGLVAAIGYWASRARRKALGM
jgi:hypothetical protein